MRLRALIVMSILAPLTMAAAFTATASAEIEFLPGAAGTLFTGKSSKLLLQIKGEGRIECERSSILEKEGELLSKTTALLVIHYTGCKSSATGTAVNSLGDEPGVVLAHFEVKTCTISTSPLVGGLLFEVLPLHIEVPIVGSLLDLRGRFVARVLPENKPASTLALDIEQKEGAQSIVGCLNAKKETEKETLETSTNGGAFFQTALEAKEATLLFKVEEEFMT